MQGMYLSPMSSVSEIGFVSSEVVTEGEGNKNENFSGELWQLSEFGPKQNMLNVAAL